MSRKNNGSVICSVRLSAETKLKVMKISEKEHRSFAEQCGFIVDDWLRKNSFKAGIAGSRNPDLFIEEPKIEEHKPDLNEDEDEYQPEPTDAEIEEAEKQKAAE